MTSNSVISNPVNDLNNNGFLESRAYDINTISNMCRSMENKALSFQLRKRSIIRNTRPMLNEFPIITNVVLIPAETPLLEEGTEVIIDALFGEANMPIPAP